LLALVALFFVAAPAIAAPDMQFAERTFDFGEVYQGEKVPHVYSFENRGDSDLIIDRVRSSCGCTAVLLSDKTVAPGDKGEIKASFDSTRFRGAINKTIYLYSNDPVNPVLQLHLKGQVLEVVAVVPAQVNFGRLIAETPSSSSVLLRNQGQTEVTLAKPRTTAAELTATMEPGTLAAGEERSVKVQLTPKPGGTRFSGYVMIPVEGAPVNELRIPVYATIEK
jgi:hypothetical protein